MTASNQGRQVDNNSNTARNIDRYDDMPELELTSNKESANEADKSEAKVFKLAQKPLQHKSSKKVKDQMVTHTSSVSMSKQPPAQVPRYKQHVACLDTGATGGTASSKAMQSMLTSTQKQDVTMHTADNSKATISMVGFSALYVLNTKSQL